jgi:hypothetical protein
MLGLCNITWKEELACGVGWIDEKHCIRRAAHAVSALFSRRNSSKAISKTC